VYASEVFPTVIRSSCIGLCIILARVGGLFAPLTRLMVCELFKLKVTFIVVDNDQPELAKSFLHCQCSNRRLRYTTTA
jgi:hypothetical protein